jgi:hypothetical protein
LKSSENCKNLFRQISGLQFIGQKREGAIGVTDDGGKVSDVEGHLESIIFFFCFVISNEEAKKLVFGVIRIHVNRSMVNGPNSSGPNIILPKS